MQQQRRVHIFLYVDEADLEPFAESITEYNPDVLYVLAHDRGEPETWITSEVRDVLDETEISADRVAGIHLCDHGDMYDVLGLVTTIASKDEHRGDTVRVNVSTGGRPAVIGATIGCMDLSTDALAYYGHDGDSEIITSQSRNGFESLATFPIDSPTPEQVSVMAVIKDETTDHWLPHKRRLIDRADELDLEFLGDTDPNAGKSARVKAHRMLTKHLTPLEENGYVEIREKGRKDKVTLKKRGDRALRAFRHKLDTELIHEIDGLEPHL